MFRLAVIADPHVHDCGWRPAGSGLDGAIRSFADTAYSTRVFNESLPAFRAALDRAVQEGARLALLVGDLTDDGQAPNIDAALNLIAQYRAQHGLRVLAVPGNHDCFALTGRPRVKNFLGPDGVSHSLDSAHCPEAATLGTAEALGRMQMLGYVPEPGDLHWETPFGRDPDWSARDYAVTSPDGTVSCRMIDASYLVEPVQGLWVLALDTNICVPRDGAEDLADPASFHDPTDAGWRAVLRHRPHLLPWIADVARRARREHKQLLAFSHYPALCTLAGTGPDEARVFGASSFMRRSPPPEIAGAIAATGLRLHFSGHLHVNDTALHGGAGAGFFNIAVPSPVGFCPAMKLVDIGQDRAKIRTLSLAGVPGHDAAFPAYRAEAARAGRPGPDAAFAPDHGSFLDRHLTHLVQKRYLPREWPRDLARRFAQGSLNDLLAAIGCPSGSDEDLPLMQVALDWYRLRKGGSLAHDHIPPERLARYRAICAELPDGGDDLAGFMRILRGYLGRLPDRDFSIDLRQLSIRDQGLTDFRQTTRVGNSRSGEGSASSRCSNPAM